jgi:hypothetical protein
MSMLILTAVLAVYIAIANLYMGFFIFLSFMKMAGKASIDFPLKALAFIATPGWLVTRSVFNLINPNYDDININYRSNGEASEILVMMSGETFGSQDDEEIVNEFKSEADVRLHDVKPWSKSFTFKNIKPEDVNELLAIIVNKLTERYGLTLKGKYCIADQLEEGYEAKSNFERTHTKKQIVLIKK